MPPLRARREDVPEIISYLLARRAAERGQADSAVRFTPEAMRLLVAHSWPGNVRELENVVFYVTALGGALINIEDLPPGVGGHLPAPTHGADVAPATLEAVERRHVMHTLEAVGGNQARAAKLLGVDRRTLYNKLKGWGAVAGDERA